MIYVPMLALVLSSAYGLGIGLSHDMFGRYHQFVFRTLGMLAASISSLLASSVGLFLGGKLLFSQGSKFDSLLVYPLPMFDDGLFPTKVGASSWDVVQALKIALMAELLHERFTRSFKVGGQEVIFQ